jgi:uncharacterized membrane protein (UPF0136 family)
LAAFALALAWQSRVVGQLEQEIVGLEQAFEESRLLLGAHQSRLAEIRGGVHDLITQLEGLQTLVDADPSEATEVPASLPGDDLETAIPSRLPAE